MHTFSGGGRTFHGGYDALDFRLIAQNGDAGKFRIFPILSKLPDKVARFLFEFHDLHFQRLDLPPLPDDRSTIDAHAMLSPEQVISTPFITLYKSFYVLFFSFPSIF